MPGTGRLCKRAARSPASGSARRPLVANRRQRAREVGRPIHCDAELFGSWNAANPWPVARIVGSRGCRSDVAIHERTCLGTDRPQARVAPIGALVIAPPAAFSPAGRRGENPDWQAVGVRDSTDAPWDRSSPAASAMAGCREPALVSAASGLSSGTGDPRGRELRLRRRDSGCSVRGWHLSGGTRGAGPQASLDAMPPRKG